MRKLIIAAGLALLQVYSSIAQPHDVKALVQKLNSAIHDTVRVNTCYALSKYYWFRHADSSLLWAQRALDLAQKINFKKGTALAFLTKGTAYSVKGKYPEALECHLQTLRIAEELKLEGLIGNAYNNIGIVYSHMDNHPKALEYFQRSLAIDQKHPSSAAFESLINIAEVHMKTKQYDLALEYDIKALNICKKHQDSAGIAIALFNIGDIHYKKGAHQKALTHIHQSLTISKAIKDIEGIAYCYNTLAHIHREKNQTTLSIDYAKMSLAQSIPLGNKELIKDAYNILYRNYQQSRHFEKALYYRDQEIALQDSMFSIEKENAVNTLQANYDLERKQHQIDLLNKDKVIQQEELSLKKLQRNTFISGVILLSAIALFLIRNNLIKQRNNILLMKQNEEILQQKEEISQQKATLEEMNALKNRLLTIISHDFRSPLHSLQGVVELIGQGAITPEEQKHMSILASEKLTITINLLENLLHWTKSQMNGLHVEAMRFDVKALVAENFRLMKNQADRKKVMLSNLLEQPIYAFADQAMTDIVLRNLIVNAIKFSKAGDSVLVSATANHNFVRVMVKDTGRGIAPEDQEKIFKSTSGFTTRGTDYEKGTGLGLMLCKELVEKNGGNISFKSEPGKGSTFTFTVPHYNSTTE